MALQCGLCRIHPVQLRKMFHISEWPRTGGRLNIRGEHRGLRRFCICVSKTGIRLGWSGQERVTIGCNAPILHYLENRNDFRYAKNMRRDEMLNVVRYCPISHCRSRLVLNFISKSPSGYVTRLPPPLSLAVCPRAWSPATTPGRHCMDASPLHHQVTCSSHK